MARACNAANSPDHVKAIALEDPPLFRCDWPNIKSTWVFDIFLGLSRMAAQGGGGYARFFEDSVRMSKDSGGVVKTQPKPVEIRALGLRPRHRA